MHSTGTFDQHGFQPVKSQSDTSFMSHDLFFFFFTALIHLDIIQDSCREKNIYIYIFYSVSSPFGVLPKDKFRVISRRLQMSDLWGSFRKTPIKKTQKSMPAWSTWDLFSVWWRTLAKLSTTLKSFPINERIAAVKARPGMTWYKKANLTKWRFILFIMTDSGYGYTAQLTVYIGNK